MLIKEGIWHEYGQQEHNEVSQGLLVKRMLLFRDGAYISINNLFPSYFFNKTFGPYMPILQWETHCQALRAENPERIVKG